MRFHSCADTCLCFRQALPTRLVEPVSMTSNRVSGTEFRIFGNRAPGTRARNRSNVAQTRQAPRVASGRACGFVDHALPAFDDLMPFIVLHRIAEMDEETEIVAGDVRHRRKRRGRGDILCIVELAERPKIEFLLQRLHRPHGFAVPNVKATPEPNLVGRYIDSPHVLGEVSPSSPAAR